MISNVLGEREQSIEKTADVDAKSDTSDRVSESSYTSRSESEYSSSDSETSKKYTDEESKLSTSSSSELMEGAISARSVEVLHDGVKVARSIRYPKQDDGNDKQDDGDVGQHFFI